MNILLCLSKTHNALQRSVFFFFFNSFGIVNLYPHFENLSIWRIKVVSSAFSRFVGKNLASRYIYSNETNQAGTTDDILSKSRDKLKTYFLYQSLYGHQTWQGSNLPWWALAHKVTGTFNYMVLQCHITNWNHYISTSTVSMATKLGRIVTITI